MAFGAELKDFVAGFQAGYQMIDSPEDREWKRKERQMRMEDHKWRGDDRVYNRERDVKADDRWERQFEQSGDIHEFNKERTARDDAFRTEDLRIKEEELEERRKLFRLKRNADPNVQVPVDMDKWYEQERQRENPQDNQTPIPDPENQSAIPEDTNQTTMTNGFQPAAYAESASDNTGFLEVVNAGKGWTEVGLPDGRIVRRKGARNWRNNNPGNIEYGSFAKKLGAIGTDGRFAVFPTYEAGRKAKEALLFENPNYRDRTLASAINRYAPPFENDTNSYVSSVAKYVGISPDTRLSELSAEQRAMMLDAMQKVEGFRPGKEKEIGVVAMASGGVVPEDNADYDYDYEFTNQERAMEEPEEGVIPDNVPVPRPRPDYEGTTEGEEPTDDIWELARRSVRDGLKRSIEEAGMNNPDGAIEDEADAKAQEYYLNGYGAAPGQLMKQVIDKIDPDHQMPPAERNMKAMGYVYRFYMDQGKPEEAKAAAASMVQYYRAASSRFLALSQAAAEEGDIDNAAQAAIAAYANIPNGRDLDIRKVENGYEVSVTDAKTGKQVTRQIVSPREFAAAAMQFTPATFDDEILNAAGMPPEEVKNLSPEDIGKVSDTVSENEGRWEEGFTIGDQTIEATPDRVAALKNAAASIASTNQMTVDEALRVVDPSDTQKMSAKQMRGNPDVIEVTKADGTSFKIRKNAYIAWQQMRKSVVEETLTKRQAEEKSAKDNAALVEKGTKAATAVIDSEAEAFSRNAKQLGGQIQSVLGDDWTMPDGTTEEGKKNMPAADRALMTARDQILASPNPQEQAEELDEIESELIRLGYLKEKTLLKTP